MEKKANNNNARKILKKEYTQKGQLKELYCELCFKAYCYQGHLNNHYYNKHYQWYLKNIDSIMSGQKKQKQQQKKLKKKPVEEFFEKDQSQEEKEGGNDGDEEEEEDDDAQQFNASEMLKLENDKIKVLSLDSDYVYLRVEKKSSNKKL